MCGNAKANYFMKISGNRPYAIAFNKQGTMYVVTAPETGNGTLSMVTVDRKLHEIATLEGNFIGPGIDIDDDNNIYVTVGDKLIRITPDKKIEIIMDGFQRAFDVKLDVKGNIYVADDMADVIYKINSDNKKEVFYKGRNHGQFILTSLAYNGNSDSLYARESNNLLKFDLNQSGNVPETVVSNINIFCIVLDEYNNIYATTASDGKVIKISPDSKISKMLSTNVLMPLGIASGKTGGHKNTLYITVSDGIVSMPCR
jgi:sugar lactone lactonase YvrE